MKEDDEAIILFFFEGGPMKFLRCTLFALLVLPLPARADVNTKVEPLSCGIYDQAAKPLVRKEMETQSPDRARYTMALKTSQGKRLTVEVKSVSILLAGERNHVSIFLDGKPYAKTSHQDVPLYFEVHIDGEKYRVICTRQEDVAWTTEPAPFASGK